MKNLLIILMFPSTLFAQDGAFRYFVSFKNKANTTFSLNTPEEFLSQKTINKRELFAIPIDSTDLPVNIEYVTALQYAGVTIENKLKWFNGVVVSTFDNLLVETLNHQFIDTIIGFGSWQNSKIVGEKWNVNYDVLDYGDAYNQLEMLGGNKLHEKGFAGEGMTIAVIDAGFYKVDELEFFADIQNQILATYDFVDGNSNVYDDHTHGMMVLSTMGGKGEMTGTAPEANYILLRTEDVFSENLIEEYMWVCAAEYADSAGADIINSSLGYTTFDDALQNHTYEDMDGETTPISIGAGIACSKGIIVVNSAGNSGSSSWHFIGAPADNFDVLSVGAVDENEEIASFSSYGPNADGALKPNVVAQGKNTVIISSSDTVRTGNGTSFSSPITAGMVACIWGAQPNQTPAAVKGAIYKSADRYLNPDDQFGYGIPNYYNAYQLLNSSINLSQGVPINTLIEYKVYTIDGKEMNNGKTILYNEDSALSFIKPKTAGVYIIHLFSDAFELNNKFIVLE
ncbi:MAG: S8 family serine peptidase [Flavobacteriales bacterium]|nr:S8 family serine peptidase [Flavobacteriales bacterium]